MGDIRIIWIPMALRKMIKDFDKGEILVSIKKAKSEKSKNFMNSIGFNRIQTLR